MQAVLSHRHHAHCACASAPFALPSTGRKYERSRPFVLTHLFLDLNLCLEKQTVQGTAHLDFARRAPRGTSLILDARAFELEELTLHLSGTSQVLQEGETYFYDGRSLEIPLPADCEQGKLSITYRAQPRAGLYFLRPDEQVPERPLQVWSQCQDEDAQHWFPCQDKPHVKMSTEIRVSVPHSMTALSNGELLSQETPEQGPWVFHYRLEEPHPAYLVTLVVGHFEEWTEECVLPSGRSIPLRYLVPPGKLADGKRAFTGTAEMIQLFSEKTGVEYPWDRYTQVVVSDFIFGGMENTTATTMYEHILLDERAALDIESQDLVAHELAHQWFGDLVTCRDWSHAWLNEGFATFFEHLEKEARLGRDAYEQGVESDLDAYLLEASQDYQRPIVCREYEEPIDLFDRHLYQKGGLVLHMLRRQLGEDCFWRGVRQYLQTYRGQIVDTENFKRALEDSSGLSLERFFDHWVYRPGHPELKVSVSQDAQQLLIEIQQTPSHADAAVFEFEFVVDVLLKGKWQRHSRLISEKQASLVLPGAGAAEALVIDPEWTLTAPCELTAPLPLLRGSLKHAPHARGRRSAARALARHPAPPTLACLEETLLNRQEFWSVRAQAADSLRRIGGPTSQDALLRALALDEPRVRRAAAAALRDFPDLAVHQALTLCAEQDASYLVQAEAARSLGVLRAPQALTVLRALLDGSSWASVVQAHALQGLSHLEEESVLEELMAWSSYGKPLRARRAAIAALGQRGEGRRVREHLIRLLRDRDPHLRTAVYQALQSLDDERARAAISGEIEREVDGRVLRQARQTLTSLGNRKTQELKRQKEETQRLERELNELKLRLSRLEQQLEPKKKPSHKKRSREKNS